MDTLRGLQAWKWLFIIEGLPSCACALLVLALFPDFPENAPWLTPSERTLATTRLAGTASLGHARLTWADARATLLDARLYAHYAACVAFSVAFSSISLFTPTIVAGLGYEGLAAQLFTVPPYAVGFVVTLGVAGAADRRGARAWAAAGCLVLAGVSFLVQGPLLLRAIYYLVLIIVVVQVHCLRMRSRRAMRCFASPYHSPSPSTRRS